MSHFKDWRNPTEEEIKKLKEDRLESKSTSYDVLKYNLEKASNGARVHTVNKAKFHIDYLQNDDSKRFKFGKNYDRLEELCFAVFCAIKYEEWRELEEHMRGWL